MWLFSLLIFLLLILLLLWLLFLLFPTPNMSDLMAIILVIFLLHLFHTWWLLILLFSYYSYTGRFICRRRGDIVSRKSWKGHRKFQWKSAHDKLTHFDRKVKARQFCLYISVVHQFPGNREYFLPQYKFSCHKTIYCHRKRFSVNISCDWKHSCNRNNSVHKKISCQMEKFLTGKIPDK